MSSAHDLTPFAISRPLSYGYPPPASTADSYTYGSYQR
jgi:hypothetical protein